MEPKHIAALMNLVINSALRGDIDSPTMKGLLSALNSSAISTGVASQVNSILMNEVIDESVAIAQKNRNSRAA